MHTPRCNASITQEHWSSCQPLSRAPTCTSSCTCSRATATLNAYISRTQSSAFLASSSASIWGQGLASAGRRVGAQAAVAYGCSLQRHAYRPHNHPCLIACHTQARLSSTCAVMASQRGVTRIHSSTRMRVGEQPVGGMLDSGPSLAGYSLRITPCRGGRQQQVRQCTAARQM